MLSRVLLIHILRASAVLLFVAFLALLFTLGRDDAVACLAGGVLITLSGAGLVYFTGKIMDPAQTGGAKAVFAMMLTGKFVVVAGALWMLLSVYGMSGIGLLVGLAVGLAGVVTGLSRGSSSDAGKRAIADAEARIKKEMEDNETESR